MPHKHPTLIVVLSWLIAVCAMVAWTFAVCAAGNWLKGN